MEQLVADHQSDDPNALEIWGYTGKPSHAPGDALELHVSTTADTWGFEIWRDGVEFEMLHSVDGLPGARHETPDDVVGDGCGWPVATTFTIPRDWASGGYIVVFRGERDGLEVSQDGFFVLRVAHPGTASKLAMIVATYSWQEYNDWGGGCGYFSDEYVDHTMDPLEVREKSFKARLSFDRPWSRGLIRTPVGAPRIAQPPTPIGAAVGVPAADWTIANGYSVWTVANGWARYDALTARWLEAHDYAPEFIGQWDLDRDPTILDNYDVVVTTGHDEYWTAAGRSVLDGFIERGGRYARLAGNIVWQVRLENDMRTQVCHKYAAHADPEIDNPDVNVRTGAFEATYIDSPPVTTFGANGLRGVYSRMGGSSPRGPGGYIVYRPGHWAFDNADVYYGDVIGGELPLVGYESDGLAYTFRRGLPYPTHEDGAPENLEILALTPVTLEEEDHGHAGSLISIADGDLAFATEALYGEDTPENRDKIRYGSAVITHMTKGQGEVFCAGSTEWCYGLAAGHVQVEIITKNVLNRFLGGS
ncbi:MAG: N,N-dimethylformamidase beta subunit family domain-containing protein [Acidimicrobiales bacterium]